MNAGPLQQQRQVAFAAQQRLDPVGHPQRGFLAHAPFLQPLAGARDQARQARTRVFPQGHDARVARPRGDALAQLRRQLLLHGFQIGRCPRGLRPVAALALAAGAAEQGVEFLRDQLAMCVELMQEGAAVGKAHGARDPAEVMVASHQHVGLLVVQVLDAVLDPPQEFVGARQGIGRGLRHQPGGGHPLQCLQCRPRAQLGVMAAANHLQQLHGELDLADAATRELDVVGALGPAGASLGRMLADLLVQHPQRIENTVVEITAEHERQHRGAQPLGRTAVDARARRHHAALEPGEPLPFAALHLEVFLQSAERHGGRARIAVGPQRGVHAEDEAVLGGLADEAVDVLDDLGEVLVVADAPSPAFHARRLAVLVIDVHQVDVAGHIEFARPELAHADDPEFRALPAFAQRRAVLGVQVALGLHAGDVQSEFGQAGHRAGDDGQRRLTVAVEHHQAFHDQLPQDAQRGGDVVPARAQGGVRAGHHRQVGCARRQEGKFGGITPAKALREARMGGGRLVGGLRVHQGRARAVVRQRSARSDRTQLTAGGHNSCHSEVFMNDCPPSPSRPLKAYAIVAKGLLWLLMTAWLVLALAWGALHGWIVPRIGELRPDLEIEAGRVLGVPVRIGSIAARSEGLIPSFELIDVVLLDPQGRPALRLPRVLAALTPRSLWNLGFEQLYIDRPELDVRRAADGKIYVGGLDFSRSSDNDGQAADWFFEQTEFVIRNGTVRWTDEMRAAPPLTLDQVDFVMRNGARRHALRLDATPPPAWGERFSLLGQFRQPLLSTRHGRWQDWEGQVHANFTRVDVSQLRRHANLGVEVNQGHGALRAWLDVARGQLSGGVADVVLADVSATLGPSLAPLALRTVSGRIGGKRLGEGGFEFETQALQFETQEGQRWPGGNVFVAWKPAEGNRPAQGELRADKLDLFALSQVASRLPLGAATHSALAGYAPRGLVETLQAKWQGPLDALQTYQARGRAVRLEIAARPGQAPPGAPPAAGSPGVRGATVDFDLSQAGGKGKFAVAKGAIEVPGVFEDPVVTLDALSADVQWQVDGPAISTTVSNLKFTNADAQGDGQATWRTGEGAARFPGVLDLQASISRADGARVYRYLPLGVSKTARDYVRESVVQGAASGARFRVKGNLKDFPFANPKLGEFRVTADVRNVTYAYVPRSAVKGTATWPALTQLSGELLFLGNGMQVKNAVGRFVGSPGLAGQSAGADPRFPHDDGRGHRRSAGSAGPVARRGQHLAAGGDDEPGAGQGNRHRQRRRATSARPAHRNAGEVEGAGQRDAGGQRYPDHTRQPLALSRARRRHLQRARLRAGWHAGARAGRRRAARRRHPQHAGRAPAGQQ